MHTISAYHKVSHSHSFENHSLACRLVFLYLKHSMNVSPRVNTSIPKLLWCVENRDGKMGRARRAGPLARQ